MLYKAIALAFCFFTPECEAGRLPQNRFTMFGGSSKSKEQAPKRPRAPLSPVATNAAPSWRDRQATRPAPRRRSPPPKKPAPVSAMAEKTGNPWASLRKPNKRVKFTLADGLKAEADRQKKVQAALYDKTPKKAKSIQELFGGGNVQPLNLELLATQGVLHNPLKGAWYTNVDSRLNPRTLDHIRYCFGSDRQVAHDELMSRHERGMSIKKLDTEAKECPKCIGRKKKVRAKSDIDVIKNEFTQLDVLYAKGNTSLNMQQERQNIIRKYGLTKDFMRRHKIGEFKRLGAVQCGLKKAPPVNQGGSLADMFGRMKIKK